jgi:hypothetical protein
MNRRQPKASSSPAFARVESAGLGLPNVEATTRYDGARVLKAGGCFMAGVATHASAEPDSLVVRIGVEDRRWLLEDAPETYYVTEYYGRYPLVLARLASLDAAALRDLLLISWRLTMAKSRVGRRRSGDAR